MAQNWALFLDFDGTLVDIAPRPDAVVVPPTLPPALAALRCDLGGALALISGRSIAALDRAFAPYLFDAAGLHGVEYRCGGVMQASDVADWPRLRLAVERLRARLSPSRGVIVEDKGSSVAVHWRMAPGEEAAAVSATEEELRGLGHGYRLQAGRMVVEIVPDKSDKGQAIATFLRQQPYMDRRALFIGDDLTDEHGFAVVNARGGVSVRVGRGASKARYRIGSPAELRELLAAWATSGRIDPEAQLAGLAA